MSDDSMEKRLEVRLLEELARFREDRSQSAARFYARMESLRLEVKGDIGKVYEELREHRQDTFEAHRVNEGRWSRMDERIGHIAQTAANKRSSWVSFIITSATLLFVWLIQKLFDGGLR